MRALVLLLAPLALIACVDDPEAWDGMGGDPIAGACGPLCIDAEQRARIDANQSARATCAPDPVDRFDNGPDGLRIGAVELLRVDGVWVVEAELSNVAPQGFFGYPGMTFEVLDGALTLEPGGVPMGDGDPARSRTEVFYGISACDAYTLRFPLAVGPDADGISGTVRLGLTFDVGRGLADELVFDLIF